MIWGKFATYLAFLPILYDTDSTSSMTHTQVRQPAFALRLIWRRMWSWTEQKQDEMEYLCLTAEIKSSFNNYWNFHKYFGPYDAVKIFFFRLTFSIHDRYWTPYPARSPLSVWVKQTDVNERTWAVCRWYK